MPSKSPLARVKEAFGEKTKLVEAVKALATEDLWLGRTSEDRGGSRGLDYVSNAKLLRLHSALSFAKEKFGSRAKLVEAVLETDARSKDAGLKSKYETYPVPRLLDLYRSAQKRAKKAGRAAAPAKAEKPAKAEAPAKAAKAAKGAKAAEKAPDVEAKKPAKKAAKKG